MVNDNSNSTDNMALWEKYEKKADCSLGKLDQNQVYFAFIRLQTHRRQTDDQIQALSFTHKKKINLKKYSFNSKIY